MNMDQAPAPALAPASAPLSSLSSDGYSVSSSSSSSPVSSSPSYSSSSLLIRILLIVLLLALIGFNVFAYLDDIVNWLSKTFGAPFRSVARFLGYAAADTAHTTVDVTAKGAKSAVDIAAGAATSGINVLQQTISQGNDDKGSMDQKGVKPEDEPSLEKALSHAKKQPPQPDDATSRTQRSGKSGYCYIGEDRGFRSCIKVGEEDTCMSGDIFPTHAICVNPRLRQ